MMDAYESNTTWSEVAGRVRAASRIALTTHERPDGDAIGSVLAMHRAFISIDKAVETIIAGPIEPALLPLVGTTPLRFVDDGLPADDPDLIIVADTGAWSQLERVAGWLRPRRARTIVIDHHARGDDIAALRIVDVRAAAASTLVVALLDAMGCPLTEDIAAPLFAGLATDTGWFRYSNAGPEALELAARLMRAGADKSLLYQQIEETHRPQRLALESRALASIEFAAGGAVAIQSIRRADFDETSTSADDLSSVVNAPMKVSSVRAAVLLAELGPALTKASFRSKPEANGAAFIDVNALARRFGGGGHVFASGARIGLSLSDARDAIIEALDSAPASST